MGHALMPGPGGAVWRKALRSLWPGLALWAMAAASGVNAGAAQPQRIISLLPSATESVCALGACQRLVGVDEFSLDPPQVRALPQLGKTWQPDMERIIALRPDWVLVGQVPAAIQRLQAAGIPYLVTDAASLEQVQAMLFKLDAVLQTGQAQAVWQRLEQGLEATARRLKQRQGTARPSVYLEVDAAMYAAGPRSFMGELLTRLGARNIAPDGAVQFMRLSPEFVLRADPDLVILAHHGNSPRQLQERPGWQHMRAMQAEQRVCRLSEDESRTVTRPGPRLDEAAAIFAACLQRLYP